MKTMDKSTATVQIIKTMVEVPKANYFSPAFHTGPVQSERRVALAAKPDRCPRCEHDVYALAMKMQYYIGAIYLDLADACPKEQKAAYNSQATAQLAKKEEIARFSNDRLNQLLYLFYNVNEGQIIPPPVSEKIAEEIQPDFDAVLTYFMNQMDDIVETGIDGTMSVAEVETHISACVVEAYQQMSTLYQVRELQRAFDEVIKLSR